MVRTQAEIDKTLKEMNDSMEKRWKENGLTDKLSRDRNRNIEADQQPNEPNTKILKAIGVIDNKSDRYNDRPERKLYHRYGSYEAAF